MRWLDIPGQTTRISAMEGLRAYAVALVFVFHASIIVEERSGPNPLLSWAKHGTYGVDLFFLLSGFLIAGLVVKPDFRYGNFLLHRIARIYPAMIGMFLLCIAGMVFLRHESVTAWQVVGNLLLLNGIPGGDFVTPINNVTWSLAYEFAFYLIFPPLYRWFGLWGSAAITALALIPLMLVDESCIRFMMFYAGAVVKLRRLPVVPALAAASYFLVTSLTSRETPIVLFVAVFLPVAMLFVSATLKPNWLSRIYSITPLRMIGNVSYSLYLLHPIALLAVKMALDRLHVAGAWFAAGLIAGGFALSFCMAAVSFALLERPYFLLRHRV
jgi:exopolysaccharide production protein ExoZ